METDSTAPTARDGFVTRRLLALAALIFALNLPTLTVLDSLVWQAGFALLYLGGALAIASAAKAMLIVSRHGIAALSR
ncbi:hypothetical protein [Halorubrum sp. T3]|uniref:hypothetical protein n=1 Tax=Halorubrum sp. T3 TaxID=1194088 RepID=UPI00037DECB3|nr:hypothetical protein [Halorubrum sp. T3]